MTNYTPEQLLATDKDTLTWICAEVCYGNAFVRSIRQVEGIKTITICVRDGKGDYIYENFQALANTESGRSQAFELAVKFDCFPVKMMRFWVTHINQLNEVEHSNPQAAIVIAAILTAQQEKTNE